MYRPWLIISLIFLPASVSAMEFSEIAFDLDGGDEGREWIELHNTASEPVDLTGFYFVDSGGNHKITTSPQVPSPNLTIEVGEFVILADDPTFFMTDHPSYNGKLFDTAMSLLNYSPTRTEPIILQLQNSKKEQVTEVSYLPTADMMAGYPLEKYQDGSWQSTLLGGSPGKEAQPLVLVSYSEDIRLSEVVANPEGADNSHEWIELENTSDQPVDVGSWYITDLPTSGGQTKQYIFPSVTVAPKTFSQITLPKSLLANENEGIRLYWPNRQLVQEISIAGTSKEGWSYSLIGSDWDWTDQLTPGTVNKGVVVEPKEEKVEELAKISLASPSPQDQPTVSRTTQRSLDKKESPAISPLISSPKQTVSQANSPKLSAVAVRNSPKNIEYSPEPVSISLTPADLQAEPAKATVAGLSVERENQSLFWFYILLGGLGSLFGLAALTYRYKFIERIGALLINRKVNLIK